MVFEGKIFLTVLGSFGPQKWLQSYCCLWLNWSFLWKALAVASAVVTKIDKCSLSLLSPLLSLYLTHARTHTHCLSHSFSHTVSLLRSQSNSLSPATRPFTLSFLRLSFSPYSLSRALSLSNTKNKYKYGQLFLSLRPPRWALTLARVHAHTHSHSLTRASARVCAHTHTRIHTVKDFSPLSLSLQHIPDHSDKNLSRIDEEILLLFFRCSFQHRDDHWVSLLTRSS